MGHFGLQVQKKSAKVDLKFEKMKQTQEEGAMRGEGRCRRQVWLHRLLEQQRAR